MPKTKQEMHKISRSNAVDARSKEEKPAQRRLGTVKMKVSAVTRSAGRAI